MSDRRAARVAQSAAVRARYLGNELPPRWNQAVDEWAVSTGWAHEGRPALNARGLARTRHPWSRAFLAEHDAA